METRSIGADHKRPLRHYSVPRRGSRIPFALLLALTAGGVAALGVGNAVAQTITAKITADNGYMLGWGGPGGPTTMLPAAVNCVAGDIFNCPNGPETLSLTGTTAGDYIYVVAWSDDAVTEGVLGQFFNGSGGVMYSGAGWEVFATGIDIDNSCNVTGLPTLAQVRTQVALANSASGAAATTSIRWVNAAGGVGGPGNGALAVGESNSAGGDFPLVSCLDPASTWMWYTTDPTHTTVPNPFNGAGNQREYLIFRRPVLDINPGWVPCSNATQIVYEGGRDDALAGPFDAAIPRPAVNAWLQGVYPRMEFDQPTVNGRFMHSFVNLPGTVANATLMLKLKANCDGPETDAVYLQMDGLGTNTAWGRHLEDLIPGGWTCNQEATLTLDLTRLPNADGTFTNLVNSMNLHHYLDVLIQDDTTIDYAKLTVNTCPCTGRYVTYTAGVFDNGSNFVPDPRPSRRAEFDAIRPDEPFRWRNFDDCGLDLGFGHTFTGLPSGITKAELVGRFAPCGVGSTNDSIHWGLRNPGAPGNPASGLNFWGGINFGLMPGVGAWDQAHWTARTFSWAFGGGPNSVLGAMARPDASGKGFFDVYVQDDTAVDALRLRVWPCPPPAYRAGLAVTPFGGAILQDPANGRDIILSDIPSGGEAGVAIDVGDVDGVEWDLSALRFDQVGATASFSTIVNDADGQEHPRSSVTLQRTGSGIEATFSAGAPDGTGYTYQLFDGDTLVSQGDVSGDSLAFYIQNPCPGCPPPPGETCVARALRLQQKCIDDLPNQPPGTACINFYLAFCFRQSFEVGGVSTGEGDKLSIFKNPHLPVAVGRTSAKAHLGGFHDVANIGSLGPVIFGQAHAALGESSLEASGGSLVVSNLTSSGSDGVSIQAFSEMAFCPYRPNCPGFSRYLSSVEVGFVDTDDFDAIFAGASLRQSVIGSLDGGQEVTLAVASQTKRADGWELALNAPGATTQRVSLLLDGNLLTSADVPMGPAAKFEPGTRTGAWKSRHGRNEQGAPVSHRWTFEAPQLIHIPGSGSVMADAVETTPLDSPHSDDSILRVDITAVGLGDFTISSEVVNVPPSAPPCIGDFNQDGGIDGSDVQDFFAAWSQGDPSADINQDGGVDGSDVVTFFDAWEQGSC